MDDGKRSSWPKSIHCARPSIIYVHWRLRRMDSGGRRRPCDDDEISKIRLQAYSWLNQSFTITTKTAKWLPAHTRPNGGWGHPRDHKHCLEVAGSKKKTEDCATWTPKNGCLYHINSNAYLCEFTTMTIDVDKVIVTKGGENVVNVMGRKEATE